MSCPFEKGKGEIYEGVACNFSSIQILTHALRSLSSLNYTAITLWHRVQDHLSFPSIPYSLGNLLSLKSSWTQFEGCSEFNNLKCVYFNFNFICQNSFVGVNIIQNTFIQAPGNPCLAWVNRV